MLISSSLPPSAAWQTAPIHNSSESAPSVRSQNGTAQKAQPANPPAAQSSEHTASDRAQQKDAPGAEASHHGSRRGHSRGHVKAQDAQNTDSATANNADASAQPSDTEPVPFQAVLNDVLPQATGQAGSSQPGDQTAHLPPDATFGADFSRGPAEAPLTGQAALQATRPVALDPAFQITKQAMHTAEAGALNQRLANGEVAFAARVVERPGAAATAGLRDAQAVIAASRFDGPRPAASAAVDPQTALTAKKGDPVLPQVKAPTAQPTQPAAESQLAGDANSNQGGDGQRDSGRPNAAINLRAESEPQDATAALQPAQHDITGIGTAPSPAAEAGLRGASAAKASAESSAPQILEPQGETAGRTSESVHNISLRLSNAEQGSVQVRLSERAGELHVSVRTPDTGLTRGLRDGLPELMGRLQVNGYRAETWQPGGNGGNPGQDRGYDAPSHGNSQQRDGGGNQQQNSQDRQKQDEQTPKWVSELESSIQRSNSPWSTSSAR